MVYFTDMSAAAKQLILVLDVYADVSLEEALGARLAPESERTILRLRSFGAPPPPPDDAEQRTFPWSEFLSAAQKLFAAAQGASEAANGAIDLYFGGLAPLPFFAYLARRLRTLPGRRILFSKNKLSWNILPLQSDARDAQSPPIFDAFSTHIPAISAPEGRLAIFISNLGYEAPYRAIDDLFRRQKQDIAAIETIRSERWVELDERSTPRAFSQLSEILASLAAKHAHIRGTAFFVAGPAALGSMLGFALPDDVPDPWFTNYESGIYHVAAPSMPLQPAVENLAPSLRLRSLRVRGVKSIRDSLPVKLPPIGVFVGRNSSGKSAFLEALQWLHDAVLRGLSAATSDKFHALSDLRNKSCAKIELDLELEGDAGEPLLHYSVVVAEDLRGVPVVEQEHCKRGDNVEIFTENRTRWIVNGPPIRDPDQLALAYVRGSDASAAERLRVFLRRIVFLRLNPKQLAQPGPLQLDPQGPLLDEDGSTLPALVEALPVDGLEHVTENMRSAFADSAQIQRVNLLRSQIEPTGVLALEQSLVSAILPMGCRTMSSFRLPAWVLSEGTRRLAALFSLLALRPPPSLLVIEEIENGLDPWTLGNVLDAPVHAADSGTNILLTTHSPFFLDKFDPEQVIHVVYRDGESHYRSIMEYEDVVRYEGEVGPGVMYISDYFSRAR